MKNKLFLSAIFFMTLLISGQDSVNVFLSISIVGNNKVLPVKSYNKIKSSDGIKLRIKPNKNDLYMYLVNKYEEATTLSLKEKFIAGEWYDLPKDSQFMFDGKFDEEKIILIFSSTPIHYLEEYFVNTKRDEDDWWTIEEKLFSPNIYNKVEKEEFIKIAGNVRNSDPIIGEQISGTSPIVLRYSFYVKD